MVCRVERLQDLNGKVDGSYIYYVSIQSGKREGLPVSASVAMQVTSAVARGWE